MVNTKKKKIKSRRIPKKYTRGISKKDKKKQIKSIRKSIKSYKKGVYIDRPKLTSYKHKKSQWVKKFEKKYGENHKTYKQISKVTGIPVKALQEVVKKGKGHIIHQGVVQIKLQNHGERRECIHL